MRNIEDRCKEQMEDIHAGTVCFREALKKAGENPWEVKTARGRSRTSLMRKIVTLRQMLMDLYDELRDTQ